MSSTHIYTGKRDPSEWYDLSEVAFQFVKKLSDQDEAPQAKILAKITGTTVYIDSHTPGVAPGVNKWYAEQVYPKVFSDTAGSVAPFQLAVVVSQMTDDVELPIRRRRNRSYLGPLALGVLDTNGKMQAGLRGSINSIYEWLNDALWEIPVASATPDAYGGICNVSYVGTPSSLFGQIAVTNRVRVGDLIDTQRRRRNALTENYVEVELTEPE